MSTLEQFTKFIGQTKEDAVEELKLTHKLIRSLGPGAMATMDFVTERINVSFDAKGVVDGVWIG